MINSRKAQMGQGGFTLIELLVVIAILAILGGAAIVGISSLRETAQEGVDETNANTIYTAAHAFNIQCPDAVEVDVQKLSDGDNGCGEGTLEEVPEGWGGLEVIDDQGVVVDKSAIVKP